MNNKKEYIDPTLNNLEELNEYISILKKENNKEIRHIIVNFKIDESCNDFRVKDIFPLYENGILISTTTTIDFLF